MSVRPTAVLEGRAAGPIRRQGEVEERPREASGAAVRRGREWIERELRGGAGTRRESGPESDGERERHRARDSDGACKHLQV